MDKIEEYSYIESLDKWWETEPFGFDNPSTYNDVQFLLHECQEETRKIVFREIVTLLGDDFHKIMMPIADKLIKDMRKK